MADVWGRVHRITINIKILPVDRKVEVCGLADAERMSTVRKGFFFCKVQSAAKASFVV